MKSSLLGSIVLAALGTGGLVGAVAVARQGQRSPLEVPLDPELERAVYDLTTEIGRLEDRIEGLEQQLVGGDRVELVTGSPSAGTAESAAAAVHAESGGDSSGESSGGSGSGTDLESRLDQLIGWGTREEDVQAFFAAVRAAGEQDEAIAALEARLALDPTDPRKHYLLAKACYARLLLESSPAGYEVWGERTVAAWDRAIALDAAYWEPRFERAEYFTYFPESEGKTPELIAELEALIELQAGSTANPGYAHTYAHLARMYLRLGKTEEAIQVLSDGVALFPNDDALQELLDALSDE